MEPCTCGRGMPPSHSCRAWVRRGLWPPSLVLPPPTAGPPAHHRAALVSINTYAQEEDPGRDRPLHIIRHLPLGSGM